MGSVSFARTPNLTVRQEARAHLDSVLGTGRTVLYASHQPAGGRDWSSVLYAAVRNPDGEVFALVMLYGAGNGEFYVKELDETVGPMYEGVPLKLLKLLTPTESKYAMEWREQAAQWHVKRREATARGKAAIGNTVKLAFPLSYGDGIGKVDVVEVVSMTKFRHPESRRMLKAPRGWEWWIKNEVMEDAS